MVRKKPMDQILAMIGECKNLLILGCDGCAGVYQEGGRKQVELMKTAIEMAEEVKKGRKVNILTDVVERQCESSFCASVVNPVIHNVDAILSLGCGVGVQVLADMYPNTLIIPGHDTMFIGVEDRESGMFHELCKACGSCLLYETGGICPVARCAKSLLNGPCGGQSKGKCEVGGWKKDCAWVLIYNRLKDRERLDLFTVFRAPKDFREMQHPREFSASGG